MSAQTRLFFSAWRPTAAGRMRKGWKRKCTVARNQSYNTRPVRPLICVRYVQTPMRVLIYVVAISGNHQGFQNPAGSRKTATRRFTASLLLPVWNVIKPALNFLIAIFISYQSNTRASQLQSSRLNYF